MRRVFAMGMGSGALLVVLSCGGSSDPVAIGNGGAGGGGVTTDPCTVVQQKLCKKACLCADKVECAFVDAQMVGTFTFETAEACLGFAKQSCPTSGALDYAACAADLDTAKCVAAVDTLALVRPASCVTPIDGSGGSGGSG